MLTALFFICLVAVNRIVADNLITGPLTDDFQTWLQANGYSSDNFVRSDLGVYGSYGGRSSPGQAIINQPVIFIHGNSDEALNSGHGGSMQTGWTSSIEYFISKGYTTAELYATTWGPADSSKANDQTHSCDYINTLRRFVQAVVAYTGATKVDIITHSMGVTLGRGVMLGGTVKNQDGTTCSLGSPLSSNVDTFVGIAGANRGLVNCFGIAVNLYPTCNNVNGFYPGTCMTGVCKGNVGGMSQYLANLNLVTHYEGDYLFVIWSHADELLGYGDLVYGYPTSEIQGQDGEWTTTTMGHIQSKDDTTEQQYNMVVNHSAN